MEQQAPNVVASRKVGTSITGGSLAGGEPNQQDLVEQLPLPPQPPINFPSSAAAVRVKEQQLAGAGRIHEFPLADEEDEEEDGDVELERTTTTGATADITEEDSTAPAAQGPTLLQRAVDAGASVAQKTAELAAGAYAAAVPVMRQAVGQTAEVTASGLDSAKQAAESVADMAAPEEQMEKEEEVDLMPEFDDETVQEPAGYNTPSRPPTISPAQRAAAAEAAAAAAEPRATTAAVLPASAGSPAATGQGYFPTVGVVAPAPKPAPRVSGQQEARHVVVERLKGLAGAAVVRGQSQVGPSTLSKAQRAGKDASKAGTVGSAGEEDWISLLVERLWPYIKAAMEETAWQMLPDILEESEPSWIHDINLKKFVLGDKEPDLSDIRVWMDDNDVMEDCYLEFAFDWESKTDIEIEIQVLPGSMDKAWIPNFIEDKLKDLLTFSVGVENAKLKGRVRLTMRPLLKRVPVVGAVQVSLVSQPDFDFDLTLGSSSSVPLEPQIKAWLKQTLQDSVFQTYILPEHYFYQVDPQAQDIQSPAGVLVVEVVEAKRVPRMDFLSRSSPFVELYVRESQRRVTSTKNNTKHPRWRESFEMPVHVPDHQELKMTMYDYDWASANDEIGRAAVAISELPPGQMQDLWLDVTSMSDAQYQNDKQDMRKREHAAAALAKPFLKQGGGKRCQVHVQATYYAFSDEEEKLIKEGQRDGLQQMLDSPQGRRINQHLRRLLTSGTLTVKIVRVEHLSVSSLVGRPSVKAQVRCRGQEKELAAVKASRQGCVQYDQPVQLDLGPDATQDSTTKVDIELKEGGWFGGGTVGRVRLPLQDVMRDGRIARKYELEGVQGHVHLEIEWKGYF